MFTKFLIKKRIHPKHKRILKKKYYHSDQKSTFFNDKVKTPIENFHQIPKLELMDSMVNACSKTIPISLENTALIGVQHILETTGTLLFGLGELGIKYDNMYLIGKNYSTSPLVAGAIRKKGIHLFEDERVEAPGEYESACRKGIQKLWNKFIEEAKRKNIENVIILDDGARAFCGMPSEVIYNFRVAGVEQTKGGTYNPSVKNVNFPLIEVATSAAKQKLESPLIAEVVIKKLEPLISNYLSSHHKKPIFGIMGSGHIGKAILNYLVFSGYQVIVYDELQSALNGVRSITKQASSAEELIKQADCIIGCTGKDVFPNIDINEIEQDKVFVSCSSEDREFLSLLKQINQTLHVEIDPLEDIVFKTNNGSKIRVLKGGFPFNFDRQPWNVTAQDIAMTQGLLFGACIQAILAIQRFSTLSPSTPQLHQHFKNEPSRQMLNPYLQRQVAKFWIENHLRVKLENEPAYHFLSKNVHQWMSILSPEVQKSVEDDLFKTFFHPYSKQALQKFDDVQWICENSGGLYLDYPAFKKIEFKHHDSDSTQKKKI